MASVDPRGGLRLEVSKFRLETCGEAVPVAGFCSEKAISNELADVPSNSEVLIVRRRASPGPSIP